MCLSTLLISLSPFQDTLCAMDSSPDNSPAMNEWEVSEPKNVMLCGSEPVKNQMYLFQACRSQTTSIAACSGRWWADSCLDSASSYVVFFRHAGLSRLLVMSQSASVEVSTVADLDRCLEFRSVVMDLLFKLVRDERDGFQHLERQIADAEKICAHLDRQCGIPRHRLWPSGSSAKRQEVQAEILRYLDLLCHLRSVHCFCQLRNRQFDHSVQLLAASPISDMSGVLREALEPKRGCNSALLPEGKEKAGSTDVDPLDEYMATIEMEARQALSEVGGDLAHPIANAKRADDIKRTFAGAVEPERQQDKPHSDVLQSVPGGHRTAEAASAEERVAESLAKAASAKAVGTCLQPAQIVEDLLQSFTYMPGCSGAKPAESALG